MQSRKKFGVRAMAVAALVSLVCVAAVGQSVSDVVVFNGNSAFGNPIMTPAQGRDSKIYGTTYVSKVADGAVFSLTVGGTTHDLYTFGYADGAAPEAGLYLATNGSFYGAAAAGGAFGLGVLFETSADGTYTVLSRFSRLRRCRADGSTCPSFGRKFVRHD